MKKILSFSLIFMLLFTLCMSAFAASVSPQRFDGNDSNPKDYTPPTGCIHYEIPSSGASGIHTARFDVSGNPALDGEYVFNVLVGTRPGNSYTQVLEWNSNFPVFAVIVKGGNAFNLYQYPEAARSDTDLVSPNNASGKPASVSHVSIVLCPDKLPPEPEPEPEPPEPEPEPEPEPCPPCPCCGIFTIVIFVAIVIVFFLLGLIIGILHGCGDDKKPKKKKGCNSHNVNISL